MQRKSSLLITGGWAHDFVSSANRVADFVREVGFDVDVVDDIESSEFAMQDQTYDLIVVYACWFQMADSRYSDEIRARWARSTSPQWRSLMSRQRESGAGLLALHTAVICFDDFPEWAEWVGGSWVWGLSTHPTPTNVTVVARGDHPIVDGVDHFVVHDERYLHIGRDSRTTVLTDSIEDGESHVSSWAYENGSSRVVYSALGHDERSLNEPTHRLLIQRSAKWVCGASDHEVRATA